MVSSTEFAPYIKRELFGGAVTMSMPDAYVDVSDIAPIPDNQEVWANGDDSLLIEIVERSDLLEQDVGRFYWEELAHVSESSASVLEQQQELDVSQDLPSLPSTSCPHAHMVHGRQLLTKSRQAPSQARPVAVWLTVIRLPSVASDVLVTANFPCGGSGEGLTAPLDQGFLDSRLRLVKGMLRTLCVQDWSLFG